MRTFQLDIFIKSKRITSFDHNYRNALRPTIVFNIFPRMVWHLKIQLIIFGEEEATPVSSSYWIIMSSSLPLTLSMTSFSPYDYLMFFRIPCVCCLPVCMFPINFASYGRHKEGPKTLEAAMINVFSSLLFCNPCINPIICAFLSPSYNGRIIKRIHRWYC